MRDSSSSTNSQARSAVDPRNGMSYRLARTDEELEAVYRLRHDAYSQEGTIDVLPDRRFTDKYDGDANAMIVNMFWHEQLAGTLRIHIVDAQSPRGPGLDTYGDILMPFVEAGETLIDASRFVTNPALRGTVPNLHFEVLRLAGITCDHFGVEWLLASVRREHAPFYKRYFALQPLTEPRRYPGLKADLILMGERYPDVSPSIRERYPVFRAEPEEGLALFGSPTLQPSLRPNDNRPARDGKGPALAIVN